MVYTREDFRKEWEKENSSLTYLDVTECAIVWGMYDRIKDRPACKFMYEVLKEAGVPDAEDYNPDPKKKEAAAAVNMDKNTIKLFNDVISAITCYNNGDECRERFIIYMEKELHLPNEVIEHVKTIL